MFFIETTKYYLSFFSKNFITAPNTLPPSVRHILLQLSKGCSNTQYNRSILPNIYKVKSKSPHNAEKKEELRATANNSSDCVTTPLSDSIQRAYQHLVLEDSTACEVGHHDCKDRHRCCPAKLTVIYGNTLEDA